jgi:hypothetical protein
LVTIAFSQIFSINNRLCASPETTPLRSRRAPALPEIPESPQKFRENFLAFVVKRHQEVTDDILLLEPASFVSLPETPIKKRNFKEISKRTSPVITRSRSVLVSSPKKSSKITIDESSEEEDSLSCLSVVKRRNKKIVS